MQCISKVSYLPLIYFKKIISNIQFGNSHKKVKKKIQIGFFRENRMSMSILAASSPSISWSVVF